MINKLRLTASTSEINLHKQHKSTSGYTKAVDMWSLGCLTTVLLTGGSPFLNPETMQYSESLSLSANLEMLESDRDWLTVGARAKDFVRRLLVLDETQRMTAKEALAHNWFANRAHRKGFEEVYARAIKGWRPRHRSIREGIIFQMTDDGDLIPVHDGTSVARQSGRPTKRAPQQDEWDAKARSKSKHLRQRGEHDTTGVKGKPCTVIRASGRPPLSPPPEQRNIKQEHQQSPTIDPALLTVVANEIHNPVGGLPTPAKMNRNKTNPRFPFDLSAWDED